MASYFPSSNARNNDQSNNKETRVQINLYATKLKNTAGLGKGTSNPFAVVTLLAGGHSEQANILGKTEM
jgi:hypothetical protein